MIALVAVMEAMRDALVPLAEAVDLPADAVMIGAPAPATAADLPEGLFFDMPEGDGEQPTFRAGKFQDVTEWSFDVWCWSRVRGVSDQLVAMNRCALIGHQVNLVLADPRTLQAAAIAIANAVLAGSTFEVRSIRPKGRRSGPFLVYGDQGMAAVGHIQITAETVLTVA